MPVIINQGRASPHLWLASIAPSTLYDIRGRLRVQCHALTRAPKHYVFEHYFVGSADEGANIFGVRKRSTGNVARIYKIHVLATRVAAFGRGVPLLIKRARDVSGGTFLAVDRNANKDTLAPSPTLEFYESPIGAKDPNAFLALGSNPTDEPSLSGPINVWSARREEEEIVLRGDEGLLFDMSTIGSGHDRYAVSIHWRED